MLDLSLLLADITIGLLHDKILLYIHDLTAYTPYHKDMIVNMNQDLLIAQSSNVPSLMAGDTDLQCSLGTDVEAT